MISQQTLQQVNKGILTDEELDEAIIHYRELADNLKCHGEIYHLTWSHVNQTLDSLLYFKSRRIMDGK